MDSIVSALQEAASDSRDRTALISGTDRVTFLELWQRSLAAALRLRAAGTKRGDRVLIAAPSRPQFVYAYFGAHAIGAIAVPVDPSIPQARLEDIVGRARPVAVAGTLPPIKTSGVASIDMEHLESATRLDIESCPESSDSADLVFTTGTSGRSKGVCLTHRAIACAAQHINEVLGMSADDTQIVPIPLNHSFGLGRLRCAVLARAATVLINGFKLPGEILLALDRHRATCLAGVPAGFAVLLRLGDKGLGRFADSLKHIEIGSAPMPIEHKRELMRLLPTTKIFMHYGLTEASRSAFIEFHRDRHHLDTVGTAAPRVRIEARDEAGRPCAPGADGTLWVTGSHAATSYWDDDELSAETFVAGWVRTGDFGSVDALGQIHLHGRADDMINSGGYKVSPEEIEHELTQHAAVTEAACIGVADTRGIAGELICAFVVNGSGQAKVEDNALKTWLRERLEPYKVPSQIVWVDALPKSESGKLRRAELRASIGANDDHQPITGTK